MSKPIDRDERLFQLLNDLCDRTRAGESVTPDQLLADFPDAPQDAAFLSELRELWATFQFAEGIAKSASDPSLSSTRSAFEALPSLDSATLPRPFGEYTLLEELGRGGMGLVYKARQKNPDRLVALKVILRGDLASPADVARFRSEAESAAQLNHPHIVSVYEVGEFAGQPFFSMKLVEGTTLSKRLADGPLYGQEAARLLLPICRAVADAHRRGVLHRDLKPSNILIDRDGLSYVSDFGLAKRILSDAGPNESITQLTHSGAVLGTPGYMAPEQAAGQRGDLSPATDVYSLGAILYAMLTGRPPFQAATPVDTIFMVLEQDPIPPRVINPRADADLEMIVLKCLQKPADLRYVSADALAEDLEAYLANEPISARSSHFSQIITRAFRETHHAAVLENWGLLWMWHSLVVFSLCLITNIMHLNGVETRLPFVTLWSVGVGTWATIFWELRRRSGPITFVERQIAHIWAGSSIASTLLFFIEAQTEQPVLSLSPVLALIAGNVFIVKAGILSGKFYIQAGVLYLTAFVMTAIKQFAPLDFSITLFGSVLAGSFLFPGWKYYRQRTANQE